MNTQILIIVALVFFSTLFILKDTISEFLFGGKSIAPSELKGFSGSQNPKMNKASSKEVKPLYNVLLDIAVISVALYILFRLGSYVLSILNF